MLQDFVMIHAAVDLRDLVGERPATLYWTMDPAAPGVFVAHDLGSTWVFMHDWDPAAESIDDYTPERCAALFRAAAGVDDLELAVEHVRPWRMSCQLAERYREDRIFLVGDAAHRFPPDRGPRAQHRRGRRPQPGVEAGRRRARVGAGRAARHLRLRTAPGGPHQRRPEPGERPRHDRRLRGLRRHRSGRRVADRLRRRRGHGGGPGRHRRGRRGPGRALRPARPAARLRLPAGFGTGPRRRDPARTWRPTRCASTHRPPVPVAASPMPGWRAGRCPHLDARPRPTRPHAAAHVLRGVGRGRATPGAAAASPSTWPGSAST